MNVNSLMFDFSIFPVLDTERLILRELVPGDAEAVFRIRGDYAVTHYNFGSPYQRIEQAQNLIRAVREGYREARELRWGLTLKEGDQSVIGICGYNYWSRSDRRASVGYDLARAYWGKGLMPEALRAVITFGFGQMQLNRIEADCTAENLASVRVLEKLGFQSEGVQREQYYDEGRFWDLRLFALLRREYDGL